MIDVAFAGDVVMGHPLLWRQMTASFQPRRSLPGEPAKYSRLICRNSPADLNTRHTGRGSARSTNRPRQCPHRSSSSLRIASHSSTLSCSGMCIPD
jgi:hypothetical protein